jgi:hypothetical protein
MPNVALVNAASAPSGWSNSSVLANVEECWNNLSNAKIYVYFLVGVLATPLLMSLYFWDMYGFEPESCPSKQALYQLSHPSLSLATNLSNLATHAISQFRHPSQILRGFKVIHQLLLFLSQHWKITQPLFVRKSPNLFLTVPRCIPQYAYFKVFFSLDFSERLGFL